MIQSPLPTLFVKISQQRLLKYLLLFLFLLLEVSIAYSHTLTIVEPAHGNLDKTERSIILEENETFTLTLAVNEGYTFAGWELSGDGATNATLSSSTAFTTTLTMGSADVILTASFIQGTYHLVTKAAPELMDGDVIVIAANTQEATAGEIGTNSQYLSFRRLLKAPATFSEDKTTVTTLSPSTQFFTLSPASNSTWTLTNNTNQRLTAGTGNSQDFMWDNTYPNWDITINNDNTVTIFNTGINTDRIVQYNGAQEYFIRNIRNKDLQLPQLYRKLAIRKLHVTLAKTDYTVGETLAIEQIYITYNNGSQKEITDVTFSSTELTTIGTKTITATYEEGNQEISTTFTVEVHPLPSTVTFMDGATECHKIENITYQTAITEPTLSLGCVDYVFQGWIPSTTILDNPTQAPTYFDFTTPITEDLTLYAVYQHTEKEGGDDEIYVLVTDVADLTKAKDGKIVITNEKDGEIYILGTEGTSNRKGVLTTATNNIIENISTAQVITLTQKDDEQDTKYYFTAGNQYFYAASNSSNDLKTKATADDNAYWQISITTAGIATIKATGDKTRNWLRFNNTSKLFSCYNSGQNDVYIFRAKRSDKTIYTLTADCHAEISATTIPSITSAKDVAAHSQAGKITVIQAKTAPTELTASITGADATMFTATVSEWTENAGIYEATYHVTYTPTESGHTTHTASITFSATCDGQTRTTETINVKGYTLPDQFIIATLKDNEWVALPGTMETATNPVPVSVFVDEGSNATLANSITDPTMVYSLLGRHKNSTSTTTNAIRIQNVSTTECLWASGSATASTIKNDGQDASGTTTNYEWTLETEDGINYYLCNPARSNNPYLGMYGGNWGMYANKVLVRFFSYSALETVEWRTDGIVLDLSNYEPTYTITIETEENKGVFTQVYTDFISDLVENKITLERLAELPCRHLKTTIRDEKNNVVKSAVTRIPIFITSSQATNGTAFTALKTVHGVSDAQSIDICKTCDVIISGEDVVLTHDANSKYEQIHNLHIGAGAKIEIADGATLNVESLTLNSEADIVPQLDMKGQLNIASQSFKLVKRIDDQRYYFFSVPYDYPVANVEIDGISDQYAKQWIAAHYDGEGRATNMGSQSNWMNLTDLETMQVGKGYAIALATGIGTKELVFTFNFATTDLSADNNKNATYTVTAYGNDEEDLHHSHIGWNFIANPFLSEHSSATGTFTIPTPMMSTPTDQAIYVAIPQIGSNQTYLQHNFHDLGKEENPTMLPFTGFFIQAQTSGSVVFSKGTTSTSLLAPHYEQQTADSGSQTPIVIGVSLTNGKYTDATSLVIGNQFTDAYEIGSDFEKMLGLEQYPQLYIHDKAYRYAFKSISEDAATQRIPLGVYLPGQEETAYTIALTEACNRNQVQAVYLHDNVENTTVNLMQTAYTFSSAYTHTTTRFTLSAVLAPQMATNIHNTSATWTAWQDAPRHICLEGITTGDRIQVINAIGQIVFATTATSSSNEITLPTAGTYCIEIIGQTNVQVKKIIVK